MLAKKGSDGMEIRDVGSNSFKSREGKEKKNEDDIKRSPRLEKVASGVKVKPSNKVKMMDIFFPEGIDMNEIVDYYMREKLAPGIKRGVRNAIDDFLDGIFGTTTKRESELKREKYTHYSSSSLGSVYRSTDKDRDRDREKDKGRWSKKPYRYTEVAFRTRAEAEEVLDAMEDALEKYHIVTVADLYELSDETPDPTDYTYGWTNLRNARVEKISGGAFAIVLPKASPID